MTTGTGAAYDAIGGRYQDVKDLPCAEVEFASVHAALPPLAEADVLDLACGTGYYTRTARQRGACRVVGVDVSPTMVAAAREAEDRRPLEITYHVHDAETLPDLGTFDVVTGVWLLNYAADLAGMTRMLEGVARSLTPGGRFVGVTQNPDFDFTGPSSTPYGWTFQPLEATTHGTRVHATAHTTPELAFEACFARAEIYDQAVARAGLKPVRWEPLIVPNDAHADGFYDDLLANPCLAVLTLVA